MPDHLHLLLVGILDNSDQRLATRFLRKHLNAVLAKLGFQLQQQPYDHVLCEAERERDAFEDVVEYIARNPERAGLISEDRFREYPYTSCLIPGYPELSPWQTDFWDRFWRSYSYLRQHGLVRGDDEPSENDCRHRILAEFGCHVVPTDKLSVNSGTECADARTLGEFGYGRVLLQTVNVAEFA
jgi:hypothetical protein